MQPPVYEPPMQPKRKLPASVWLILGLLGIGCCAGVPILAAILVPVFAQARGAAQKAGCMSSIRQESLAAFMYASENNDHWAYANGWETEGLPYLKNAERVRCPVVPRTVDASGYAFNTDLSHKHAGDVGIPMFFETDDLKRNAHSKYDKTPSPNRHRGPDASGRFVPGRNIVTSEGNAKFVPSTP